MAKAAKSEKNSLLLLKTVAALVCALKAMGCSSPGTAGRTQLLLSTHSPQISVVFHQV